MYCWGDKGHGALGDGTVGYTDRPTAANGPAFATLAVGAFHNCGLTVAGAAYCWGQNYELQIGNGATTPRDVTTPVAVVGGLTFASISTGGGHTCGIASTGKAYCWGGTSKGSSGIRPPSASGFRRPRRSSRTSSLQFLKQGGTTPAGSRQRERRIAGG